MRFSLALVLLVGCANPQPQPQPHPQPKPAGRVVIEPSAPIEFLEPITFDGAAELSPAAQRTLTSLAKTINDEETIKRVEVQVHITDGSDATARQALADRRARAMVDYLIAQHVAPARLRPKGFATPPADGKFPISFEVER